MALFKIFVLETADCICKYLTLDLIVASKHFQSVCACVGVPWQIGYDQTHNEVTTWLRALLNGWMLAAMLKAESFSASASSILGFQNTFFCNRLVCRCGA